jgi:CBS domain-containing protein
MLSLADVPTVGESEPLLDAIADLGGGRIDRALVLNDGNIVGLLSITDVGRLVAAARPARRPLRQR